MTEDFFIKVIVGAAFIAVAILGALGILAAAKEYKEETARLETKGCKIIWHEPRHSYSRRHEGETVTIYSSSFDLWQCPGEPIFKR